MIYIPELENHGLKIRNYHLVILENLIKSIEQINQYHLIFNNKNFLDFINEHLNQKKLKRWILFKKKIFESLIKKEIIPKDIRFFNAVSSKIFQYFNKENLDQFLDIYEIKDFQMFYSKKNFEKLNLFYFRVFHFDYDKFDE